MNDNTFAAKCGRFVGHVLIGCIATCMVSVLVALTVRFITWLV